MATMKQMSVFRVPAWRRTQHGRRRQACRRAGEGGQVAPASRHVARHGMSVVPAASRPRSKETKYMQDAQSDPSSIFEL